MKHYYGAGNITSVTSATKQCVARCDTTEQQCNPQSASCCSRFTENFRKVRWSSTCVSTEEVETAVRERLQVQQPDFYDDEMFKLVLQNGLAEINH
jgi:hypothetical protein